MRVATDFKKIRESSFAAGTAVAVGNFDGVHLGHRRVLECMKGRAHALGLIPSVLTFWPHPASVLRPERSVKLILPRFRRLEALQTVGVQFVLEQSFDDEFAKLSAREFFEEVLLKKMNARCLVVGPDFCFGRDRQGDLALLNEFCLAHAVELHVVEPLVIESPAAQPTICSSSRIREFLVHGDIERASAFLGRHFHYEGEVVKGDQRGRTIGFPTANLHLQAGLIEVATGVYAGWAKVFSAQPSSQEVSHSLAGCLRHAAVANVGLRPTFTEGKSSSPVALRVEVHLLDFSQDIYGQNLAFEFVARARAEKKFAGIQELKAQIERDVEWARGVL